MLEATDKTETAECPPKKRYGLYAALGGAALTGAAALLAYKYYFRPWHQKWGATPEEMSREMPGDKFIEDPRYVTTRAVTINAAPSEIFPWLIQMGQGRGGAYTYDWIENALGLNMHSADRVVPELQFLSEGDFLPLGNKGDGFIVKHIGPDKSLVFENMEGNWTWEFGLYPDANGSTRLVSRNRIAVDDAELGSRAYLAVIDPGAFVMERKMLLGIKERVERVRKDLPVPTPTIAVGAAPM